MDDKRLTGVLVSFFHNGSVFHEILQQKRSHAAIRSLEVFISELQNNNCVDRTKLKEISRTITRVVNINQQNSVASRYQLEYSQAIEAIFRFVFNLPCFVTWISDIGGYLLSVPVPKTEPYNLIRTSNLLRNQISGELLKNHPTPALVMQLIRQEHANVIPSLAIDVYAKGNGIVETRKFCLQTVICLNSRNELTTYIRQNNDESEPTWRLTKVQQWNYFNTVDLPGFEKHFKFVCNLKNLESVPDDWRVDHSIYIMKKCIFLVYVPLKIKDEAHESRHNPLVNWSNKRTEMTPDIIINSNWRGIHGDENSCFMDSLLMSWLFHPKNHDAFVRILESSHERLQHSQHATKLADVKNLLDIIGTIALRLQSDPPYCEKSVTWELRKVLSKYNLSICGEMLDVAEFINLLFGSSLEAPYFITYRPIHDVVKTRATKEIGSYLHQIIVGPALESESVNVATLLERSMKLQGIRFKVPPEPFLIIKLPLSNGRLVGVESVVPSLELEIGDTLEEPGLVFEYQLMAIVCLQDMHYTAFIRKQENDWIYFDSMSPNLDGPEALFLDGFTVDLTEGPVSSARTEAVQKVYRKSCLYIYTPVPTSKVLLADKQVELESRSTQHSIEYASSSPLINTDTIAPFIGVSKQNSDQNSDLNVNLINLEMDQGETGNNNRETETISADVVEILKSLLYVMQMEPTPLLQNIMRGITKKLNVNVSSEDYKLHEEITVDTLIKHIFWNTEKPTLFQTQLCRVWEKLVEFSEVETSDNTCIELPVSGTQSCSVYGLYLHYYGRKETSPLGLVISLNRNVPGPQPVYIQCTLSAATLTGWQTLQLYSVICCIEGEGLIAYTFDAKTQSWTKKLSNGQVQTLQGSRAHYLGFLPAAETSRLSDNEIVENFSIAVIYSQ